MGKFADTFLGQPTPGGSAGGSPNTTQQINVVGNSFAKQFNVSPELWRQEPVQTMPVQTVEPIQDKKQNFIQKGLQKAGNIIKNIFNPKDIEPTMYFDETPFVDPMDVKQKNILQMLLEPVPEKYRKQSFLRSLNPIAGLKDSIAITQEILSKPEYYDVADDLADIQEGKFLDTKIKEAQDFLSDPEAYVNLFGNPKYPVYGVHLAEALSRIQKPYVDSLNANPAWQGLNIGLSNTLLGSSEEVKKSLDQQLVKPVDGFGKTLYKVNEITGSIIPWVLGMNSLKATKLAKLAFPIVSATLGQTSVNANLEQRLKKLPVDVVAGWLYSIVPISKMSWTRQGMIDLARGTTAFASIGGISGFINSLTLGMSKEEALENAKNIATTMALFHIAGQVTNYFLTPQQAMGNKTFSPQEIRDIVESSKYKNTQTAKDLMKISLEAEQSGKNVSFDYNVKTSSPLVKIGNKIFGKEILEKIGAEYKSVGQFKYTLVDAPQPSMLPGQAVPETGITTTGTPTPQTPTPVAPVVPVQQPPKAPSTKTPDVIKETKVEYKSVEDLLDDGVKNIKTTPELDKIVKETRLPDVVEQYDDIYKNVIDKLPEPEFGKIRVFSSNGSLTQDKINVGDFSDVDYLTDSLEGHFQYRYSPDEGIVVADVDPDKIAIMEGGRGDFGYYRVVKKLTPEDIVYSKAVNTGIESQEIKKDSTEGIVEPQKKAVNQQEPVSVKNVTVYRGSDGNVEKIKMSWEKVLNVDGYQPELLKTLADSGNKNAQKVLDNRSGNKIDFVSADKVIRASLGGQYDAIKYSNSTDNRSQIGTEYHDLKTNKFYAENESTASAYSKQNRSGKYTATSIESNEKAIRDIYKKNEEKVYDALSQVFAEMEVAEAGQRLFIEQPDSSEAKVIGISSTFPKWIPEELRSKDLFDKVLSGIVDIDGLKYPTGNRTAQRALYDAILDEIDSRSGVDTSKYRSAIIDLYEKPSTKQTIKAKKPVSKRIEGGKEPKQTSKEKPQEKQKEKVKVYKNATAYFKSLSAKELEERAKKYTNIDDFLASFDTELQNIEFDKDIVSEEITPEISPEEQRVREKISMENFREAVNRFFPFVKEFYEDDGIINVDDYLEKIDSVVIDLEFTSYQQPTEHLRKLLGGDDLAWEISVSDIVEMYKNKELVPTIGKTQFRVAEQKIEDIPVTRETKFYETNYGKEVNIKKVYETATARITNSNRKDVTKARKELFLAWANNKGIAEEIGITQTELNKKIRTYTGASVSAITAQQRANSGIPDQFQWTGITNSNFIYKVDLKASDVDRVVNNIDDVSVNRGWGSPDGDSLRHYIMNTFLSIDTRINYDDLNFNVHTLERALGQYDNREILITIDKGSENTVAHEIGHYLDYRFARELGMTYGSLSSASINWDYIQEKYGLADEHIAWSKEFIGFVDNLKEKGDIGYNAKKAEYLQTPTEVFARFTAKFVDWVASQSGYHHSDLNYYSDRFSVSDYYGFITLLQKKAELDTKYDIKPLVKGDGDPINANAKLTGKEAEIAKIKSKLVDFYNKKTEKPKEYLGYNPKPSGEVGKYVEEQIKKHPEKIVHKTSATKEEYRGMHEAPTAEGSAPLYDVAGIYTENQIYPEDIYSSKATQYYGHYGDPALDYKAIEIIQRAKGHPDRFLTAYRAVPKDVKGSFNVGDWVTTVRDYAKEHGETTLNGDYKIISKTVHARDLFTDGNSIFEFGYDPQPFVNLRDRPFDMLLERQKEGLKQAYAKEAVGSGSSEELGYNPKNIKEPNAPETKKELDKIIKRSDIAKELSEKFNVPIRTGKFRRSALGIYKMRPEVVRLKGGGKSGGLPTVFHEVGHHLDKHFNMSDDINIKERKDLMTEYGFSYEGKPKLQKQEAFAEFIRYRTTGQNEKIARFAPEFSKTFEKRMDDLPEIKEALDKARDDWRRWNEQPAVAKVLSQISIGKQPRKTLPERLNSSLHELYTSALDDIHPLSEFSKIAKKKLGAVPAEQDPYILARTLRGWSGKADLFLNKGTFGKTYWKVEDGKTKMVFTGKPYSEIMKPIDKAGMMDEFRVYIVSERAIELAERGIVSGVSKRDAQEAIADLESKYPEIDFKKISEERRKYKDSLLNYAKDSGLVGDDGLKMIKELNKYHVPFYRVMEETISGYMGGRKLGGNISSPIKKIRGSERDIIDPLESDVKDTYAILNASERNNIGIAMANLASKDPELGRLFEKVDAPMSATKVQDEEIKAGIIKKIGIPLEFLDPNIQIMLDDLISDVGLTVFRPIQDRGSNMLNVNRGDKKEVYQVEQDLFRAIQGLNVEDVGLAMRILATPAKLLRAGATLSPDFSVRNPIRDQFSAMIYSNYGFRPGIDMLRGMFELFGKGDAYNLWKASGGESSTLVSIDRDFLQKSFQDILKSNGAKALDYIKNPIELLRTISEIGEQSTRLGEMKRALDKQATPLEGAYSSRDVTLDFAKIGAKTKALNLISAFWNANVQGTDKMVRSFKTHPFRTLLKTLLGITLPSILLYFANRDDERWDEIPSWQKNLFWIVMTPEHIYRIPKPFELGIIFGSIPERVLEYIDEQDKTLFDDLIKSIADGASPGFIPTALIPIIENITNYSFFRERPIVSRGQEDYPPEAQYGTYTSELSKIIGESLNYSPSKVDNLIQGYTGGLGKYATSAIDSILKGTGIVTPPASPAKTMEDLPVIRAFMIRKPTGSSSESVNKVYNMYSESTGQHKYVKKMVESGKIDEAKEYIKNNPSVANAGVLTVAINTFSQINKARDAVRNSRDLSPEEKRIKIAELDELMLSVAQQVLGGIENEQN